MPEVLLVDLHIDGSYLQMLPFVAYVLGGVSTLGAERRASLGSI